MKDSKPLSKVLDTVLKKGDMCTYEIALLYYELYDIENGTVHHQIFKMLYKDKTYTYLDEICIEFGMDSKTLYNYRKKYEALLEKIKIIAQNLK